MRRGIRWKKGGGDVAYRILAIDDDVSILRLIKNILNRAGYETVTRSSVEELDLCDFADFDLILLDVMMPWNGLDLCRHIRAEVEVPILFVTAKELEEDLVKGLDAGADDYITKPFTVAEFLARIRMHLRREERGKNTGRKLVTGEVTMDLDRQKVLVGEEEIPLTKRERRIVQLLMSRADKVFSMEEIYERVYPGSSDTLFRSISEYIYQIRTKFRKVGLDPFETVRGGGYRWKVR